LSRGELPALDAGPDPDPPRSGTGGGVLRVTLDGKPLTRAQAGQDLRFDDAGYSFVLVDEPRLYGLVRLEQFGSHELRLGVMAPGLSLFSFTFGAYEDGV
jgi:hypothetical protein